MSCHCGLEKSFEECCQPFINGKATPETAEQLMRSRYSAYVSNDLGYIKKTLAPESQSDFDMASTKEWAAKSKWKGLKILSTKDGKKSDTKGTVEFIATYTKDGKGIDHHEVAEFRKTESGQWLFVDGDAHTHAEGEDHHHHHVKQVTVVREGPKIGRNDPCSCGSGKKYKKCCATAA